MHIKKYINNSLMVVFLSITLLNNSKLSANVVGSDVQNFNTITSGLDFISVQSSETLLPGYFNVGLFLNYAGNTLPSFTNDDKQSIDITDRILGADVNFGIGIMKNWDFGISLPYMIAQDVESPEDAFHGQLGSRGITEVRLNSKVRILGNESYGVGLVGSINVNMLKNNPFTGENSQPIYNIEVVSDITINNIVLGLNLGYRIRTPGTKLKDSPIVPLDDQIIASVAASYLFSELNTKVILEIFSSIPNSDDKDISDRLAQSSEAIIGIKHNIISQLALHGGVGTEVFHGRSSPDWRVYIGLNWSQNLFPKMRKKRVVYPPRVTTLPTKPRKAVERVVVHDILFEYNSSNIVLAGSEKSLNKLAKYLRSGNGFRKLIIEGHTDSMGSVKYNNNLSLKRAQTIKNQLVRSFKFNSSKITTIGKGELEPIANNGNFQGRQLNRRVVFIIFRNK